MEKVLKKGLKRSTFNIPAYTDKNESKKSDKVYEENGKGDSLIFLPVLILNIGQSHCGQSDGTALKFI